MSCLCLGLKNRKLENDKTDLRLENYSLKSENEALKLQLQEAQDILRAQLESQESLRREEEEEDEEIVVVRKVDFQIKTI